MMSLPNTFVYMQFHPVAYIVKLNIEMSMAELITKVARADNISDGVHHSSSDPTLSVSKGTWAGKAGGTMRSHAGHSRIMSNDHLRSGAGGKRGSGGVAFASKPWEGRGGAEGGGYQAHVRTGEFGRGDVEMARGRQREGGGQQKSVFDDANESHEMDFMTMLKRGPESGERDGGMDRERERDRGDAVIVKTVDVTVSDVHHDDDGAGVQDDVASSTDASSTITESVRKLPV
jgi:hypothetical protein